MTEAESAALTEDARKSLGELKEKKAKGLFDIASFYEKTGKYSSATVYYKELIDKYPETSLAAESANRVMKIEKRLENKR